jgi:arginase
MGMGPLHLLGSGAAGWLRSAGHDVLIASVQLPSGRKTEAGSAIAIHRQVAQMASAARLAGRLPLLLSGNCNASLGLVAGAEAKDTGVLWLDAHGDFNTPETTLSGYFDGMALALICGLCWRPLAHSVPGFEPLDPRNALLVGARDLDAGEQALLEQHGVPRLGAAGLRQAGIQAALEPLLAPLRQRVSRLLVHIDLDVLDRDEAQVNEYSSPGGLTAAEVGAILRHVKARFEVIGVTLSSYDPDYDAGDRALRAAEHILGCL